MFDAAPQTRAAHSDGLPPRQPDGPQPQMTLAMADEGRPVRIVALRGGRGAQHRLSDLGLAIGSEVTVVQRSGCGLVVARDTARVALGGGMAMKVMVAAV